MNMLVRFLSGMVVMALAASCASIRQQSASSKNGYGSVLGPADSVGYGSLMEPEGGDAAGEIQERMIAWRGDMTIEVDNVSNAVERVLAVVTNAGGYVSRKGDSGEKSASLTLRIPARAFVSSMDSLGMIGKVTSSQTWGTDVTEDYIDTEARLKNKKVLRDRLQQLLDKAAEVKDILAIEKELNRVQSDIDSMEARIKSLRNQVDYAILDVTVQLKPEGRILGPLGWVGWFVKKLFVIRE